MRGASTVFHLATLGVRHSIHDPVANHEVNATGTLRLLEIAREFGTPRFVYVSTSEVFGTRGGRLVRGSGVPPGADRFARLGLDLGRLLDPAA